MARARNIKPGFFRNAELVELPFEARLLFIGLWTIADRAGRLEDRPKQIKMELFPADNMDCDALLAQLASIGMIERYEHEGARYIQVVSFAKHQNPHKDEKASTIPDRDGNLTQPKQAPAKHCASTVQAPCKDETDTVAIGLIPDSLNLIPDSPQPNGCVGAQDAPAKPKRGTRLPQDWFLPQHWGQWALDKYPHWSVEVVRDEALKFANHWRSATGKSASKLDWYGTWQNWCMSDICQRAHPPPSLGRETDYQRSMRERVAQAAGSMAHIVAARAPGLTRPPEPWEVAANEQNRTITHAVGGPDLLEADGALWP